MSQEEVTCLCEGVCVDACKCSPVKAACFSTVVIIQYRARNMKKKRNFVRKS
uniref:Uncharacterized protein n=1 Tax=Anguilla anguilla TaxID=7936 RepID=A0A0E9VJJ6_ANGAN